MPSISIASEGAEKKKTVRFIIGQVAKKSELIYYRMFQDFSWGCFDHPNKKVAAMVGVCIGFGSVAREMKWEKKTSSTALQMGTVEIQTANENYKF